MKIGFLIIDFTAGRGGERVAATVANSLCKSHEVHILSLYQQCPEPFFKLDKKVNVHVLLTGKTVSKGATSKLKTKFIELTSLRRHIKNEHYDILIGVGSYPSVLLGAMAALISGKTQFVAWEHSNFGALNKFWMFIRRFTYPNLKGVICLNKTDKADFEKHFENVTEISNPLSFNSALESTLTSRTILSVGALEHEKGFDLLIKAFKKFHDTSGGGWELLLIGEGSQRPLLLELINNFGLSSAVQIKDPVKDIQSELLRASLYVLPSRREGFGMVLIEAMECGLPCISFNCPTGPRNIIEHKKNGILVAAENTDELAHSISELVNNPEEMKAIAIEAKQSVMKYDPERINEKWLLFINDLVNRSAKDQKVQA